MAADPDDSPATMKDVNQVLEGLVAHEDDHQNS